jgi:hypothetical protein
MWPANWATTRPGGRAAQPAERMAWALRCLGWRPQKGREQVAERTWAAAATAAPFSPLPHSTTATLSLLLGNRLSPSSLSGSPSPVLSLPRKHRDRELYGSIQSTVPVRNPSICSILGVLVSSVSSAVCCSRWWWCGAVDAVPWCCLLIL